MRIILSAARAAWRRMTQASGERPRTEPGLQGLWRSLSARSVFLGTAHCAVAGALKCCSHRQLAAIAAAAALAECMFADPFAGFRGVARFKKNVGNLGSLMRDVKLVRPAPSGWACPARRWCACLAHLHLYCGMLALPVLALSAVHGCARRS